jgi:hypothetical protein
MIELQGMMPYPVQSAKTIAIFLTCPVLDAEKLDAHLTSPFASASILLLH